MPQPRSSVHDYRTDALELRHIAGVQKFGRASRLNQAVIEAGKYREIKGLAGNQRFCGGEHGSLFFAFEPRHERLHFADSLDGACAFRVVLSEFAVSLLIVRGKFLRSCCVFHFVSLFLNLAFLLLVHGHQLSRIHC